MSSSSGGAMRVVRARYARAVGLFWPCDTGRKKPLEEGRAPSWYAPGLRLAASAGGSRMADLFSATVLYCRSLHLIAMFESSLSWFRFKR